LESVISLSVRGQKGRASVISLEVLNVALVLPRLCQRRERAQVAPLPGRWALLPAIQTELSRFQFPDHSQLDASTFSHVASSSGSSALHRFALSGRTATCRDKAASHNRKKTLRRSAMKIDSLQTLLLDELKDLYSAEKQITKALPKMAKAATSDELRKAFETHLKETEGHIERLDRVFETLGKPSGGKTCQAMKGLLEEGEEIMKNAADGEVRDAAMISAAQRVEHYEMAGYGSVRTYAKQLGQKEIVDLLQKTLDEEGNTDHKLTQIAMKINPQAKAA
jgi:ferritin-like metal-binding protein YciE